MTDQNPEVSSEKTQPLCSDARLNFKDRVLCDVEKNRFIALAGKGGHSGLMPSKL